MEAEANMVIGRAAVTLAVDGDDPGRAPSLGRTAKNSGERANL